MTNGEWEALMAIEEPRSTAGLTGWQRYFYDVWMKDVKFWYADAGIPPLVALFIDSNNSSKLYWLDTTTLGTAVADDLEHPPMLPL